MRNKADHRLILHALRRRKGTIDIALIVYMGICNADLLHLRHQFVRKIKLSFC